MMCLPEPGSARSRALSQILPGFRAPGDGDSPRDYLQDMGEGCAGAGGESSGHQVRFARSFGL